eukprot:scaffold11659_cov89-Skeletonema_dohrnii-CCMP3373.AAC.6
MNTDSPATFRNDHTTVTAPLPVCSAKLSTVGPDVPMLAASHTIFYALPFYFDRPSFLLLLE